MPHPLVSENTKHMFQIYKQSQSRIDRLAMANSKTGLLFLVVFLIFFADSSSSSRLQYRNGDGELSFTVPLQTSSSNESDVYSLLESYGFPSGLLPEIVESYTLDEDDGSFILSLESSCRVDIPNAYPVKYSSTITGTISYGSITDLTGITVKVFFIWWQINSITVSGQSLIFKVGPASATYPISNFDEHPACSSTSINNNIHRPQVS